MLHKYAKNARASWFKCTSEFSELLFFKIHQMEKPYGIDAMENDKTKSNFVLLHGKKLTNIAFKEPRRSIFTFTFDALGDQWELKYYPNDLSVPGCWWVGEDVRIEHIVRVGGPETFDITKLGVSEPKVYKFCECGKMMTF